MKLLGTKRNEMPATQIKRIIPKALKLVLNLKSFRSIEYWPTAIPAKNAIKTVDDEKIPFPSR
jgi:hypothetical protein